MRQSMTMSDGEKLIAFMLADLMSELKVRGEIEPEKIKTWIAGDDMWAVKWAYGGLFHDEGPSEDVVQETADIMTMCRVIENSINQLLPEELAQIPENERQVFFGFDGNEEPHFGVAHTLINDLDRFTEWQDRPINSHMGSLGKYRRMKHFYDERGIPMSGVWPLTDIQTILAL